MRLGLHLDMRKPPGDDKSWGQFYGRWLERMEEGDRLGCPSVWLTEHHFFDDGYLPQVWTFAAALAARTRRMRLGSAIAILPLHTAVETAEQVALVDVISGGRVEPGFGVGYRRPEYQHFQGDFKKRYGVFRQRIQEMRAYWGETPGATQLVTPAPVQKRVPMWGGFNGPQGAKLAGELGLGLASLKHELLEPYLEGLAAGGYDASQARMGHSLEIFVTDDPDKTWAEMEPFVAYRWASYNRYMFEGTRFEADPPEHFDPKENRKKFILGTPEQVVAAIRERTAGLPVTDLYTWADYTGMSDAAIDRHIELIVTQVAPRLVD
jgi:alkanesulfonate monooxygenase SsuD/methylene tetrahydromethanopterin reductase-like flavin-dependent oxidoreductase (luciferase family)